MENYVGLDISLSVNPSVVLFLPSICPTVFGLNYLISIA